MSKNQLVIKNMEGKSLDVTLQQEAQRQVGAICIDGVMYHIEKMPVGEFYSNYTVDTDKNYEPHTDADGCCVTEHYK